jgi:coniferyl-aldehyde dehydrogenase
MSHAKGVFVQGRWNLRSLLHALLCWFADLTIAMTLGRRR